jgi:NAD(P)-dependent dehydrogenase (short-subunit alcohol dehydrogenase family)
VSPIIFNGTLDGALSLLPQALQQAGLAITDTLPAAVLLNVAHEPAGVIAAAEAFADAVTPQGDRLVINLLADHARGDGTPHDWVAASAAATIWAFTRHAALAWGPRGIRVNALSFGACPDALDQPREDAGRPAFSALAAPASLADIAATILAFCRLRSMTGQIIRLGALA